MAKGSHDTYGGWEPKTCAICQQPFVKARHDGWFHWSHISKTALTFHMWCVRNNPQRLHQLLEEADREPIKGAR